MKVFIPVLLLIVIAGCASEPAASDVEAQLQEAIRWYTGETGRVNDLKAKKMLREAAESDHPLPTMWMARCYARGRMLFDEDSTRAQTLARTALEAVRNLADRGSVEATFLLGSAYAEGLGVLPDAVVAAQWYHKAGERGHVLAQHNLGNVYFAGDGVPQSDSAAARWWREAADKGDAIAQYRMGFLYEEGRGVPRDVLMAGLWYRGAAERGERRAVEALVRLGGSDTLSIP